MRQIPGAKTKARTGIKSQVRRPKLYKVIMLNDDFTPRDFVVMVLRAEFWISEEQAVRVMMAARRKGVGVAGIYSRDVAETKATLATEMAQVLGFPLQFQTEPEE